EIEDTLYRIAREALTNVQRHASAATATLTLMHEGAFVMLVVRDDGQGFVLPAAFGPMLRSGHLGLASMRARAERLRANFTLPPARGPGPPGRARVPEQPQPAAALTPLPP